MLLNAKILSIINAFAATFMFAIAEKVTNINKYNSAFRCFIIIILTTPHTESIESLAVRPLNAEGKMNVYTSHITNITRHHNGDVFSINGKYLYKQTQF